MATALSRRGFLTLSTAVAGTAVLAACTPQAAIVPSPTPTGPPSGPLTVWNFSSGLNEAIKTLYAGARPDVRVNLVEMGLPDVQERLLVSLATSTDLPGVVSLSNRVADQYLSTGGFLALDDALAPYAEGFGEEGFVKFDGKTYGYALNDGRMAMWINAAYLGDNGIDASDFETWDALADAGRKLAKDTGSHLFVMPTANNAADYFASVLNGRGTGWWDADGKVAVDEKVAVDTLDYLVGLVKDGSAYPGVWTDQAYWELVRQNKVAGFGMNFAIGGRNLPTNVPEQEGQWAMLDWPKWKKSDDPGTGTYGSTFFAVPNSTDSPDVANDFVTYWLGEEGLPELVKAFGTVPYGPVADTAEAQQEFAYFGGQPIIEDLLKLPYPPAHYFQWSKVQEITGFAIDQAVQGTWTAEEAIENSVKELTDLT